MPYLFSFSVQIIAYILNHRLQAKLMNCDCYTGSQISHSQMPVVTNIIVLITIHKRNTYSTLSIHGYGMSATGGWQNRLDGQIQKTLNSEPFAPMQATQSILLKLPPEMGYLVTAGASIRYYVRVPVPIYIYTLGKRSPIVVSVYHFARATLFQERLVYK